MWRLTSQPMAGRQPLAGRRLTDWAKQKSALETGSHRPQQPLIQPDLVSLQAVVGQLGSHIQLWGQGL